MAKTKTAPKQTVGKHDMGIAERFRAFRKKHVSNSINNAAPLLGISKSTINRIENGLFPVTVALLKRLQSKFNLNREWLIENQGNPLNGEKKTALVTNISELGDKLDAAIGEIAILNKNLTKLWGIVETQSNLIEELRNKLHRK